MSDYAKIEALRNKAENLRRYAASLESQAYELDADAYAAQGDLATADYYRALARGDGERGYIRLRALQFIARGEFYEGDNEAKRAAVLAEVARLRAEAARGVTP